MNGAIGVRKGLYSLFGEYAPRLCQLDLAVRTVKQSDTDAFFQFPNLFAEGRLSNVHTQCGATEVQFFSDGDGNRVQKSNGKLYWYGSGTEILDESDASGNITNEYVFFAGKRVARRHIVSGQPDSFSYYFADHLGSSRVVTDASGTILDDSDFYPFGGERPYIGPSSGNNYKFTGKERDSESCAANSCLDNFGARYYAPTLGRFLTPDWSAIPVPVPYAELGSPQTLNLYSYVANNPTNTVDPEGHFRLDNGSGYRDPDLGFMYGGDPKSTATQQQSQTAPATQPADTTQPPRWEGQKTQDPNTQQPPRAPDHVDQMTQAHAKAIQQAKAEQDRKPTAEDTAKMIKHTGNMADAGVKAGLVVVGGEAVVAVAVVAGPPAVAAVGAKIQTVGVAGGAAAETYVSGGVATVMQVPDFVRGFMATNTGQVPQNTAGLVGLGVRVVYENLKTW